MANRWEDETRDTTPWRGWLAAKASAYAGFALGIVALGAIVGVSYVGARSDVPSASPAVTAQQDDIEEDASAQGEALGHDVENHGRCVAAAAAAAKEAGLKGPAKGAFMSGVASDESLVADKDGDGACDFSEALDDALAQQAASGGPGKSDEAKENRPDRPDAADEHGQGKGLLDDLP